MDFFTDKDKQVRPIGESSGISENDHVKESEKQVDMNVMSKRADVLNKKAKRKKVSKEEFDKDVAEGNGENVQVIEPIGFLDAEERKKIEDNIGDKLEEKQYDVGKGEVFSTEDGREYMVFKSYDDAEEYAKENMKDMFESDKGTWEGADWVKQFLTITDTDRRIIAGEESDRIVEDRDDDEILDIAESDDIIDSDKKEELTNWKDSESSDDNEKFQKAIDRLKEQIVEKAYDRIYKELEDPVQYFVEDQGMYSLEDLAQQNFITQDFDGMVQYVIDNDGIAGQLAGYDGDEVEIEGLYLYRTN